MSYLMRVLGSVGVSTALVLTAASAAPAFAGDRKEEACDDAGQARTKKPPSTSVKWNVKNMTKRTSGGSGDGGQDCKRGDKGCEDPAPAEATEAKVRVRGWDPEKKEAVTDGAEPTCMAIKAKGGAAGPGPTPPKKKD